MFVTSFHCNKRRFDSLEAANAYASRLFSRKGVVAGVEKKTRYVTPKWEYCGDINLTYGGLFWREDGSDDYVLAVEVLPASEAGGPDNVYYIESGSIYLPEDAEKRASALSVIGVKPENATRRELVEAFRAYAGIDRDRESFVRIGKPEKCDREGFGSNPDSHDYVLRSNASLERFVKNEFLD